MAQANSVPRRVDLLDQMHRANRFAWILLLAEIALIGIVAVLVDWGWVLREPILTTVAIGAMVCPFASSVLIHLSTKKKRIQDLKESTRFGTIAIKPYGNSIQRRRHAKADCHDRKPTERASFSSAREL